MSQSLKHVAASALAASALLAGLAMAETREGGDLQDAVRADFERSTLSGSYLAARIADRGRDIASAAGYLRAALADDPENLYLLERATVMTLANGNIEVGLDLARRLVEAVPENRMARIVLAVDALKGKQYAQALTEAGKAEEGPLVKLTGALLSAWATYARGDVNEALGIVDAVEGASWYDTFKSLHAGLIAAAAGREETAIERLEQAHKLDGNAVRIVEAYAGALARAGRRDDALAALDTYLERFPSNPLARRARSDIADGSPPKPIVRTAQQGAAEALVGIGSALGREGGIELAALYLNLGLALDPNTGGGFGKMALANFLSEEGLHEAALELYRSVPEKSALGRTALLRAAGELDELERVEEAKEFFAAALEADPGNIETVAAYGNMLRREDAFQEAADVFTRGIDAVDDEKGRRHWTLHYFRGISHERGGEWEKAEADFKAALELYPDQPLVLNYLGYSWVDKGRNLEEALDMIRRAVELRPNDGYIVDSLGWAYYKLGRYEDAVAELEKAVSLKPSDPVINDHLGDAYWKVGRELEAQFQWRHARDAGAEAPERALILRKIRRGELIEPEEPEKKQKAEDDDASNAAAPVAKDASYTVQSGESLWGIAVKAYGRGSLYRNILDANRDRLDEAGNLRPGMRLRLPEVDGVPNRL